MHNMKRIFLITLASIIALCFPADMFAKKVTLSEHIRYDGSVIKVGKNQYVPNGFGTLYVEHGQGYSTADASKPNEPKYMAVLMGYFKDGSVTMGHLIVLYKKSSDRYHLKNYGYPYSDDNSYIKGKLALIGSFNYSIENDTLNLTSESLDMCNDASRYYESYMGNETVKGAFQNLKTSLSANPPVITFTRFENKKLEGKIGNLGGWNSDYFTCYYYYVLTWSEYCVTKVKYDAVVKFRDMEWNWTERGLSRLGSGFVELDQENNATSVFVNIEGTWYYMLREDPLNTYVIKDAPQEVINQWITDCKVPTEENPYICYKGSLNIGPTEGLLYKKIMDYCERYYEKNQDDVREESVDYINRHRKQTDERDSFYVLQYWQLTRSFNTKEFNVGLAYKDGKGKDGVYVLGEKMDNDDDTTILNYINGVIEEYGKQHDEEIAAKQAEEEALEKEKREWEAKYGIDYSWKKDVEKYGITKVKKVITSKIGNTYCYIGMSLDMWKGMNTFTRKMGYMTNIIEITPTKAWTSSGVRWERYDVDNVVYYFRNNVLESVNEF